MTKEEKIAYLKAQLIIHIQKLIVLTMNKNDVINAVSISSDLKEVQR